MFQDLLARLGAGLSSAGIPYMIIGGQAVLLYGEPRLTADIDITVGVNPDQLPSILSVADSCGLRILTDTPEVFTQETMVLPAQDSGTGIRVDFIFSFTSYETEAIGRAKLVNINNCSIAFASPEDMVIHKVFAGRPRDIDDARSIVLKQKALDTEYIYRWLGEFDRSFPEKKFLQTFKELLDNSP